VTHVVTTLVVAFGYCAVLLVVALLLARLTGAARARQREEQRHALRVLLLTALLGDPPESDAAVAELKSRTGRPWARVEEAAFALLPKIKGHSHAALVTLLTDRGAAVRATARAQSWSMVRRARGAYQLGALARSESLPVLVDLLGDRHFLVRRGAVRALGALRSPEAVRPLLDAVVADDALARDVVAAITRIGTPASAGLREMVQEVLVPRHQPPRPASGAPPVRRAAVAAIGLGMVGDVGASSLLVRALRDRDHPGLAEAAADALGQLGAPDAVTPLLDAVAESRPALRAAAARAVGNISDRSAATGLAATLEGASHDDARAIAGALLQLGRDRLAALGSSTSPYAIEALAVHALRQSA
jgi:HEAT repeat protein